jgi:outer membrane murein-binding lipoprotein Lpp
MRIDYNFQPMFHLYLVQELRSEVENLASRVLYMHEAKEDVRSDISVMKRAAEKAHGEVTEAEQLKKKQDFLVDRLTQKVDRLHEEISMYEAQTLAQEEETRSAQKTLSEAITEIEVQFVHARLFNFETKCVFTFYQNTFNSASN